MSRLEDIKENSKVEFLPILSDECEKVLLNLIKNEHSKEILEIGTCVGYSSTKMLLENKDAHIDTIEIDKARQEKAIETWKEYNVLDRVTSYLGDVNEILENVVKDKMYDFVFIDGPKSRYLEHLKVCLLHVKSGGIILADDVLFFGLVNGDEWVPHKHRTNVKHLREFLSYIKEQDCLDVKILEEGNGIAIIRVK
jgi:predicted O-methyltransferase YrrM